MARRASARACGKAFAVCPLRPDSAQMCESDTEGWHRQKHMVCRITEVILGTPGITPASPGVAMASPRSRSDVALGSPQGRLGGSLGSPAGRSRVSWGVTTRSLGGIPLVFSGGSSGSH